MTFLSAFFLLYHSLCAFFFKIPCVFLCALWKLRQLLLPELTASRSRATFPTATWKSLKWSWPRGPDGALKPTTNQANGAKLLLKIPAFVWKLLPHGSFQAEGQKVRRSLLLCFIWMAVFTGRPCAPHLLSTKLHSTQSESHK